MKKSISIHIQISLLLIATLGVMSGITVVSSLPLISHSFSNIPHIEFLSKMMLIIPSIMIAIFAPIMGIIVDKFGRLKPLYIGIILFILGGSSGFYLENFYEILVGRAVLGLGVATIMTCSMALIGDYFNEEMRHKFMSRQGMAVAFGGIIFITTGGLLAQIHWSYPFAIYFIPLLFLPYIMGSLYEPEEEKETPHLEFESSLLPVFLTAFFVMILFYMLPTQLPYLIVNTLHGEPKMIGFVIASAMLFNAMMAIQYAKIKAKFSYLQIYSGTFFLFGIGLLLVSQATSINDLFYSVFFIGMAFGLLFVNTNAWFLSKVSPKKRGKASGILTSSFFLGQFSSPFIMQPLVSAYGIQGLFFIISFLSIIISITLLLKSFSK